jgi:hypothetical protein
MQLPLRIQYTKLKLERGMKLDYIMVIYYFYILFYCKLKPSRFSILDRPRNIDIAVIRI